jgi:hypothetical protein
MGRVVHGASCLWGELSLGRVVLGRVVREPENQYDIVQNLLPPQFSKKTATKGIIFSVAFFRHLIKINLFLFCALNKVKLIIFIKNGKFCF